jgi:hypothetical protein
MRLNVNQIVAIATIVVLLLLGLHYHLLDVPMQ